MQRKICAVYGDDAVTDRMCQKWFVKFCAGDFSLDDVPWSRRQVEVDSDQTETLTGNDQHSTMWDIANIHKISKLMKLLVKMKNVSFLLWKKLNGLFGQPNLWGTHRFLRFWGLDNSHLKYHLHSYSQYHGHKRREKRHQQHR